MSALLRILVLAALAFGGYKFYPKIKPEISQLVGNSPQVLGESVYKPIANTINQILPDNINLPIPQSSSNPISETNSSNSSAMTDIVNSVKEKATDIAAEQVEVLKKEAGKAFCQALVEKIKTECGE